MPFGSTNADSQLPGFSGIEWSSCRRNRHDGRAQTAVPDQQAAGASTAGANATAERFVGSIRRTRDRILIINQRHATAVLCQYKRPLQTNIGHTALSPSRSPAPPSPPPNNRYPNVQRHDRLGGLIHEYQQFA
jgi:hypothetical protein